MRRTPVAFFSREINFIRLSCRKTAVGKFEKLRGFRIRLTHATAGVELFPSE